MIMPDYQRNNIVNLMSSILSGFGAKSKYNDIPELTAEIKQAKNVVLLVIDGMGADNIAKLKKFNKKSFLAKHYFKNLTSVFPSTTTAAITTFQTGLAPQEHGLVSWDMYLKEFGEVASILPYTSKIGKALPQNKFNFPPSIAKQINEEQHAIIKKELVNSPFTTALSNNVHMWGIRNFNGLLNKIQKAINFSKNRKYIYAYWGEFDSFSHHYGKDSPNAQKHLRGIDKLLREFAAKIKSKDTLLLITADHGQINTSRKRTLLLNKHALFTECLTHPAAGEPRALFCYVNPQKKQQFEQYVKHNFGKYCTLHAAKELVDKKYFGLFNPHPQLLERVGDYVLLLKENYVFRYFVPGEKEKFHIGNHGGLSEEEMVIPLIKVRL